MSHSQSKSCNYLTNALYPSKMSATMLVSSSPPVPKSWVLATNCSYNVTSIGYIHP